jgi:hypothetical protein
MLTKSLLKKQDPEAKLQDKQEEYELEQHASETEASVNDSSSEEDAKVESPKKVTNTNSRTMQWTMDADDYDYYKAQCIQSTNFGIDVGGCSFVGQWTFKNNGAAAWPRDIFFSKIRGDNVEFNIIGFELREEGPFNTENLTVTVDFKLPLNPGCYSLTFGLTYGFDDGLRVGDEVTIKLESKSSLYDTLSDGQFSLERFFEFALAENELPSSNEFIDIDNPYDKILSQATNPMAENDAKLMASPYDQYVYSKLDEENAETKNRYSELLEMERLLTEDDEEECVEKLDLSNDSWLFNTEN